jgi:hypothetical protein
MRGDTDPLLRLSAADSQRVTGFAWLTAAEVVEL